MEQGEQSAADSVWSEDMSVGVPELDRQHQEILSAIGELRENLQSGVEGLLSLFLAHFQLEEAFILKCHVSGFKDHHFRHDSLIAALGALKASVDKSDLLVTKNILDSLMKLFSNHIRTVDKRYSGAGARGAKAAAATSR